MNLRDKQFYRSIFEVIFQNPEAAKEIFSRTKFDIDNSVNEYMHQIMPLVNYVCDSDFFDIERAVSVASETLKDESLIHIFEATILNNIEVDSSNSIGRYCEYDWRYDWKFKKRYVYE